MMIGSWVKYTITPVGNGTAIGRIDGMLANDAIKARL